MSRQMNSDLEKAIKASNKKYGNAMSNFANEIDEKDIISYSTGSKLLDLAISSGKRAGLPEGRLIELFGPQSSGKTTISLLAIAERQKIENQRAEQDPNYDRKICVFVDAEYALDLELARQYGVNTDELLIIRPDEAEDGMDILDSYIRTGGVGLAVVDSVSALVPASVDQSSYQQQHMAVLARFMAQVATRMSGVAWKNGTTILFINQVREAVGKWSPTGNAVEITPGGHALKFHSTLRIRVRRGETIGSRENPEGHVMKVQIVKNKIDKPHRTADVKLIYGLGIDVIEELGEAAIALGVVHQGGAWFKVYDKETGELLTFGEEEANYQGRARLFDAIEDLPDLREYIEKEVFFAEKENDNDDELE